MHRRISAPNASVAAAAEASPPRFLAELRSPLRDAGNIVAVADIRPTTVLAYPYPLAASAWRHPGARGKRRKASLLFAARNAGLDSRMPDGAGMHLSVGGSNFVFSILNAIRE
jgi:hypothetical protein